MYHLILHSLMHLLLELIAISWLMVQIAILLLRICNIHTTATFAFHIVIVWRSMQVFSLMCMTCWYLNLLTIYRWCNWSRGTCLRVWGTFLHRFWHCFWSAYNIWVSALLSVMINCLTVRYTLILFHILAHDIIDGRAIRI